MGFDFKNFMKEGGLGPVGDIFGGLFGNSGGGYDEAAKRLQQYMDQANKGFEPFLNAGHAAIPQFQDWSKQFQDPNKFLNDTFSNYHMSPGAMNSMNESQRAATNAASAGGLTGSTAHMREAGNIANQISSKDMQQYLQNVLGIGNNFGQSLNTLMQGGMGAASGMSGNLMGGGNTLANLYGGSSAAGQGDQNKLISGFLQLLPFLL